MGNDFKDKKGIVKSYLSGFLRGAVVALLVMIQFIGIVFLSIWLRGYSFYIYTVIEVLSIIIILSLINDSRSPSYKIVWICIILVLPLTGHIMYALWGKSGSKKKIEIKVLGKLRHGATFYDYSEETMKEFENRYPTKARMVKYLEAHTFPLFQNNQVDYYPMGEDTFNAIIKDIDEAKKFVMLNFFIVGEGILWDRIHDLLVRKISEGVEVMFMYDDFGAMLRTPKNFRRILESEGFKVQVFNPIHKYTDKLYMNYRSHQKIIVVDGNIGYTGGMNLADEYINLVDRFGRWKDNAVRIEGDAVWGLTVTFLQMWEVCTDSTLMDYTPYRPTKIFPRNQVFCQVMSDGPANNPQNPIESFYKQMIHYSKKYLYVTTPYLVLEPDMQESLVAAAQSGVDVRIITPHIPDKKSVKIVTNYNYGILLKAGIRIYEYLPGFIHAKTIINEDCGVVGTINMDYRSFYLHYECGVFMCNSDVITTIKEDLLKTMEECHEVTYKEWKDRPWHTKLVEQILNLFATLM
jgi:cardiolipin synthase